MTRALDGGQTYDEAYGPQRPTTRRRIACEWDDPTFVSVEIDEAYMARETSKANGVGRRVCCRAFDDIPIEQQAQWPYQALHQLGHNRVAFSTSYFADVARVDENEAVKMLDDARKAKWIARVDVLWIGTLGSRR